MEIVIAWLLSFLAGIAKNVGAFVVLCLLDVGLGIAASIRKRSFDWQMIAQFYATNVLSYFLGWFIFALCGSLLASNLEILGEWKVYASTGWIWATWLVLVAQMFASIARNFKDLYGKELSPQALEEGVTHDSGD